MYINRITFSIEKKLYSQQDWKDFNGITSYFERLLHHYLPNKVNLGGFGFFSNKLQTKPLSIKIHPYGQCIDYYHLVNENVVTDLLKLQLPQQIDKLGEFLKKSVLDISVEYKVDTGILLKAIEQLPNSYNGFEEKLKVSKYHKSRRIRIEVIRSVSLKSESILCRILNKANDILGEWILEDNTTIWDCSYSYRRSKWKENTLEIYDRFDREHKTINVKKYIDKAHNM